MEKIIEVRNLYKNTVNDLTSNVNNWIKFLNSASWNFKYDFDDQVLIYAQRPDAKACAEIGEWNRKLKRWIKKVMIFLSPNMQRRGVPPRHTPIFS